ncbi:MAG: hypothetical protein ACRDI2_09415 [Chloroflexota bacterium]
MAVTIRTHEELKDRLFPYISAVSDELSKFIRERNIHGRAYPGAHSTDRHVIVYVSYLPENDPSRETIDATISVGLSSDSLHLTADVCESNGRVLFEAEDHLVPAGNWASAVESVEGVSAVASAKLLDYMKKHLTDLT